MEIVFDAILDQMRTESVPLTRLDRFLETAYKLFGSISPPLLRDVIR